MLAALPRTRSYTRRLSLSLVELVLFMVLVSVVLARALWVFVRAVINSVGPRLHRGALAIAEPLLQVVQLMALTYCEPDDAYVETSASSAGTETLSVHDAVPIDNLP